VAGVFVGTAAFFGRNHGVYGFISFLALILLIRLKIDRTGLPKRLGAWSAGIAAGFSPLLLMAVFAPGFHEAFVDSVLEVFRVGGTNLHLPVPWPWKSWPPGGGLAQGVHAVSTGILFVTLPIFYGVGILYLLFSRGSALKKNAPLTSCVLVGAAYMHYIFSRADLDHLALGIHPMLMGILLLPFLPRTGSLRRGAAAVLLLVAAASLFSVGMASPYYIRAARVRGPMEQVDIVADRIWVGPYSADLIRGVKKISEEVVGEGASLLIAPHWTTFYPILGRESPLRDIYFLFREAEERQKAMVQELDEGRVDWVILGDVPLDGRDELRFRNTHHLLWRHIMDHFEPVRTEGLPGNYTLLRRR